MSKKNLLRSSVYAYHVTARANNQEWFYLPIQDVWEIMCKHLYTASVVCGAKIHSFVLMYNHYHLLISTPDENLDEVMMYFMRETSREINFHAERKNHIFGGRYKWSLIQDPRYFSLAYCYIYQNPVRAGICAFADQYTFSSLQWITGKSKSLFPLYYPSNGLGAWIPVCPNEQISWLDQYSNVNISSEEIRLALKRSVFKLNLTP